MQESPIRLLHIEDNSEDARRLRAALCAVPGIYFRLTHVERSTERSYLAGTVPFDLVFFGCSRRELDTLIEVRVRVPTVPIIVLISRDDANLAAEAMRRGAQDLLVKSELDSDKLARSMRSAIARKKAEQQFQRDRVRQATLRQINLPLVAALDLQSILGILLESLCAHLPDSAAAVKLFKKETGGLETLALRNFADKVGQSSQASCGESLARCVIESRSPVVVTDLLRDSRRRDADFLSRNRVVSYLGIPLIAHEEFLGVAEIYSHERHEFNPEEVAFFMRLAELAAAAIHRFQLQERLKASNEELEKALQVKSVLLGMMSHELRTPIQVIMGTAGVLEEGLCGPVTEEQRQRLRTIQNNADDLLRLVHGTLDMTRLEQGKMPLEVEEVPVEILLEELSSEFSESFRAKGIELEIRKPAAVSLKTDRVKLKEILRNLVDNARKFTAEGKVAVACARTGGDRVEFTVQDTGIGIKKETLPRIFELFYQAGASKQKESVGTGLGLNIVKRLVESLSGEIHVASELGKGTTFRVNFPKEVAATEEGVGS